jgi:hypothetical protein
MKKEILFYIVILLVISFSIGLMMGSIFTSNETKVIKKVNKIDSTVCKNINTTKIVESVYINNDTISLCSEGVCFSYKEKITGYIIFNNTVCFTTEDNKLYKYKVKGKELIHVG